LEAVIASYSFFGLILHSNRPIPEVAVSRLSRRSPDIEIKWDASPHGAAAGSEQTEDLTYLSPYLAPSGEPALRIWKANGGSLLHLRYFDGIEFWVNREGRNAWALWPESTSIENAASYFLGPVLGLMLRLRGVTCLHASAVVIDGKAVAFVGSAGAGKSTTAAALAGCGCSVLSDDIVALSASGDIFKILPSYPYISLWPEPLTALFGSADAAPRFIPTWEKRCVFDGSHGIRFEGEAVPLAAIYILGSRQDEAAAVATLSRETAFLSLVANSYATNLLSPEMRAREFEVLSRLVARVPVRQISASQDLQRIDELCRVICADCSGRMKPLSASV
jgi:hypothetical protein